MKCTVFLADIADYAAENDVDLIGIPNPKKIENGIYALLERHGNAMRGMM